MIKKSSLVCKAAIDEIFFEIGKCLGENVLDFGCGNGILTYRLHRISPTSFMTGYDLDEENIMRALKMNSGERLTFSCSKRVLNLESYDSVVSSFVLHEAGSDLFRETYDMLEDKGVLYVVDYNLKGVGKKVFFDIFIADAELAELEEYGRDVAWGIHTNRGLEDCVRDAEEVGFKTIIPGFIVGNYFLWAGQK